MNSRRKFLKNATMGSIAITGISNWNQTVQGAEIKGENSSIELPSKLNNHTNIFSRWEILFDEEKSVLTLTNGTVRLDGKLAFHSGNDSWTICPSRDGVSDRYAMVDTKGDVQGYIVFISDNKRLELLFYHRTAQAYKGVLSFEGQISFYEDGFPCRTRPKVNERVMALRSSGANSLLNDSLFSPINDAVLQLGAAKLLIKEEKNKKFIFSMQGRIEEAAEALFNFTIEPDYFKVRYTPYYHVLNRERCPKAPTGWMSWNTYFDKATAQDNLNEAKIGAKYLLPFGCEFWSIESWQDNSDKLPVSDFYNMDLEVNEKQFPEGMKKLADDIRALGFRPGIWMAPFGTGHTKFYDSHKKWFLHDELGAPIHSWNGRYTLDPTVKEARDHLKHIFHIASHEWGYEFFKIDGMSGRNSSYCAHLYERPEVKARFHDPSIKNPFELCVQVFREAIGEDRVLLACQGHSTGPEPLYADASRLGADIVHPNEPVRWDNVLNQGKCFINQAFTHNIVMIADPDTLLINDLPLEEARVTATIVALPGQLTFFGDKLATLSEKRMKILQQTLPVADIRPVNLFPYFSMLPVWNLQVCHKQLGEYNVVALFNWEDTAQTIKVTSEELGIDCAVDYIAYEFWTESLVPLENEDPFCLAVDVASHSVRVVVLQLLKYIPQWVGSDRHIVQNAMEIVDYRWLDKHKKLKGAIQLIGGFPLTMRIHVPNVYMFNGVVCDKANCTIKQEDTILSIKFLSKESMLVPFEILFG